MENGKQDRMARSIVKRCIRLQLKWASWMQGKTECLSHKGKVMALLLFCLLTGAYCLFLVFSGLRK